MASNILSRSRATRIHANIAAATTTQNSSAIDMQGWDGVLIVGDFASAMATGKSVNLAQSTASGGTFLDLAGSAQRAVTNFRFDVYRPRQRFMRVEYHRSSVALGTTWAIQYGGRRLSSSATDDSLFLASPTQGTA